MTRRCTRCSLANRQGRTVGLFNPVHPWTVQVLGDAGAEHLSQLDPAGRAALSRRLAAKGMTTLIVARGVAADADAWTAAGIECSVRQAPAHDIVHALRQELPRLVPEQVVHGVFLLVHGIGVLIEGAAASGKSTLALDLLARGHALVADDAVELRRPAAGVVVGRCPGVLKGYLEARGLGIVDVRAMHGAARCARRRGSTWS
jgi:HPr kinase/phosphorylase